MSGSNPIALQLKAPAANSAIRYRWFADSALEGDGFETSVPLEEPGLYPRAGEPPNKPPWLQSRLCSQSVDLSSVLGVYGLKIRYRPQSTIHTDGVEMAQR